MIQRIQTLFLLLALAALALLFFIPFAACPSGQVVSGLRWPLVVMQVITSGVVLVAIFLFKRRMLQIRLCVFNIVMLLGYQALAIYLALQLGCAMRFVMPMPVVAAIFCFLAVRAITRDELLIRSINRLR